MGNKKSVMVESHHRFDMDKLEYDIEIKYFKVWYRYERSITRT